MLRWTSRGTWTSCTPMAWILVSGEPGVTMPWRYTSICSLSISTLAPSRCTTCVTNLLTPIVLVADPRDDRSKRFRQVVMAVT